MILFGESPPADMLRVKISRHRNLRRDVRRLVASADTSKNELQLANAGTQYANQSITPQ